MFWGPQINVTLVRPRHARREPNTLRHPHVCRRAAKLEVHRRRWPTTTEPSIICSRPRYWRRSPGPGGRNNGSPGRLARTTWRPAGSRWARTWPGDLRPGGSRAAASGTRKLAVSSATTSRSVRGTRHRLTTRSLSCSAWREGLGFFDEEHNVTGATPNDIELHPVIYIKFL